MNMRVKQIYNLAIMLLVFAFTANVYGMPILAGTYDSSSGSWTTGPDADGRQAEAYFYIDGGDFKIDLTNLALNSNVPNQVLVGIIFGAYNSLNLSAPMVSVASDSHLIHNGVEAAGTAGTDISGEWAYRTNIYSLSEGRGYYGLSASSFDGDAEWEGFFGKDYIIDPYNNLEQPVAPGGADYGILGENFNNPPLSKTYVQNSVTISWEGITEIPDIEQVHFLYGTDYVATPVPEPATVLLFGAGLAGLAGFRKRSKRS
jgi:hypothetical protein